MANFAQDPLVVGNAQPIILKEVGVTFNGRTPWLSRTRAFSPSISFSAISNGKPPENDSFSAQSALQLGAVFAQDPSKFKVTQKRLPHPSGNKDLSILIVEVQPFAAKYETFAQNVAEMLTEKDDKPLLPIFPETAKMIADFTAGLVDIGTSLAFAQTFANGVVIDTTKAAKIKEMGMKAFFVQ